LDFVKEVQKQDKIIAAICHGPQVLISAGVLKNRTRTCVAAIKADVTNAGAKYLDKSVVVDRNLITSRYPADLPHFCREIVKALK
jgi:protease I